MRLILLASVLCLAGCDLSTLPTKVDSTLSSEKAQTAFELSCAVTKGIDTGYTIYAANHNVGAGLKTAVSGVEVALWGTPGDQAPTGLCIAPYADSSATAIAKVMAAGLNVLSYLNQAKAVNGDTVPTAPVTAPVVNSVTTDTPAS